MERFENLWSNLKFMNRRLTSTGTYKMHTYVPTLKLHFRNQNHPNPEHGIIIKKKSHQQTYPHIYNRLPDFKGTITEEFYVVHLPY